MGAMGPAPLGGLRDGAVLSDRGDGVAVRKGSVYDVEQLEHLSREQDQVIARWQALRWSVAPNTLDRYTARGGRWQRLLPGVYLAVTGTPTQSQREVAALLYAGQWSLSTRTRRRAAP